MSNNKKAVELIPDTKVTSGWTIKHDGKEGNNPNKGNAGYYPEVKVAADTGPQLIVFKLPKNGPEKFNQNDPMWIQKTNAATPTSPTQSGMDAAFPAWDVSEDGKTLVVLDMNMEKATYSYRVKADGYDKVLDPIVDNGGGVGGVIDPPGFAPGGGYSESQYISAAAIALLVGILIGFFVHKMFFGPKPVG